MASRKFGWPREGVGLTGEGVNWPQGVAEGLGKVWVGLGEMLDGLGKVSDCIGKVSDGLGKVLDDLVKVSDGLGKARAFQKHITLRGERH